MLLRNAAIRMFIAPEIVEHVLSYVHYTESNKSLNSHPLKEFLPVIKPGDGAPTYNTVDRVMHYACWLLVKTKKGASTLFRKDRRRSDNRVDGMLMRNVLIFENIISTITL